MSKPRLIVVANRLPVTVARTADGVEAKPSSGGLVAALNPVLRQSGGCWIGWSGLDDSPEAAAYFQTQRDVPYSLAPVFLTEAEQRCFYHGCSNEILWPLFHDLQTRCNFDPEYWDTYREVTEKYADAVETVVHRDDFVWVHDYHLMLLADALRARDLRTKLAYFHHIPFPPPDIFEKLPWRDDILRALLRFNTIGFQTVRDRRNFIACLRRWSRDVSVQRIGSKFVVRAAGLCATVGAFPISIDFHDFESRALDPAVIGEMSAIRKGIGADHIVLGVDRLDYTKGIPERLLGFRALLRSRPELHGRVSLLQVVVPSREEIANYQELKLRIERLVSEINGEFGTVGWTPVRYLHRCVPRAELVALYGAADTALVTPLKDGMNLVAKEFCASRPDHRGVLLLSEFAGAAAELSAGAVLINPYDVEGIAAALYRSVTMSAQEQGARMQRMREAIRQHDVFDWCRAFCGQAFSCRSGEQMLPPPATVTNALAHAVA